MSSDEPALYGGYTLDRDVELSPSGLEQARRLQVNGAQRVLRPTLDDVERGYTLRIETGVAGVPPGP